MSTAVPLVAASRILAMTNLTCELLLFSVCIADLIDEVENVQQQHNDMQHGANSDGSN